MKAISIEIFKLKFKFNRLKKLISSKQFSYVFQHAKKIKGHGFNIHVCPNNENYCRLGMIISKRQVRKAIERNRIKRIIRESFRLSPYLNEKGLDIVVTIHRQFTENDRKQQRKLLDLQWTKLTSF